jgi:biotin carboxyl carrier protein
VWKTPLGGRYYGRSSPAAEPFVKVGDVIKVGQTVALIEVMKTFNRASYGGAGLPEEARVKRIVAKEGDDVGAGDVILELE